MNKSHENAGKAMLPLMEMARIVLTRLGIERPARELLIRLNRLYCYGLRNPSPIVRPLQVYGDPTRHVFFGYYDVSPIDYSDSILLALRSGTTNTSPKPGEAVEVGYFMLNDSSTFHVLDRTTAWCWQQGCRLQWYPLEDAGQGRRVLYNVVRPGGYGAVVRHLERGLDRELYKPVYACTPDGLIAYGLNFSRLQRLRPGYGYGTHPDTSVDEAVPAREGLYVLDMKSGHSETLFTVADIAAMEPERSMSGAQHYFNHICCSPDGSRFLFFHLWLDNGRRRSRMFVCSHDGRIEYVTKSLFVSHYAWESPDSLLCYCKLAGMPRGYIHFDLERGTQTLLGQGVLEEDGHPSYVPGADRIITDTGAPNRCNEKRLLMLDRQIQIVEELGRFYMGLDYQGEVRCDLHPRASHSGKLVCIDSAHLGRRVNCVLCLD